MATKLAKREAKIAKREARMASKARAGLGMAGIAQRRAGGGTLLTEHVLVFVGYRHGDFGVFDQDAKLVGSVQYYRDKPAKVDGYHLCGADDDPLATVEVSRRGFGNLARYKVSSPDGSEIATVAQLSRGFSSTSRPVMAGTETVGCLNLRSSLASKEAGQVVDANGSELVRIREIFGGCYIAEINPSAAGRFRIFGLVASIICEDAHMEGGGG